MDNLDNLDEIDLLETNATTTSNCTNEYCVSDEDYFDMMIKHIYPTPYRWFLIFLHAVVFLVGLIGNSLVCWVVFRVASMRTVTNYFIVNLALADFLVILFCLPTSVIWDTTGTWLFGQLLCKLIVYLQTVAVAVSVLTLTFISLDRWYAICYPLKFNSTTSRAKTAIIIIWIIALLYDIPELITLRTRQTRQFPFETVLFTTCDAAWGLEAERNYNSVKILFLYFLPLTITSVAYLQIVRVLWRSGNNIPGHFECRQPSTITGQRLLLGPIANDSAQGQLRSRRKAAKMLVAVVIMFAICYFPVHLMSIIRYPVDIQQNEVTVALAMLSHWLCYANSAVNPLIYNFMSGQRRLLGPIANASAQGQLRSRRKAAKMLVAVVIMFAICYFPVHLMSILRYTVDIPQNEVTVALAMLSHWLCYANSAVNPLIYNFMSGKFRKEFKRACTCRLGRTSISPKTDPTAFRMSSYASRYIVTHRTEVLPLSVTSHFEVD